MNTPIDKNAAFGCTPVTPEEARALREVKEHYRRGACEEADRLARQNGVWDRFRKWVNAEERRIERAAAIDREAHATGRLRSQVALAHKKHQVVHRTSPTQPELSF